ncbi:hypothetical protein HMPREF2932_09995 [Corynebacterium sp. HMSC074H12]|nr:hypothetical protein HMPREF2932_09995 [Corynebacterium sp. HMSC074H12]
MLKEAIKLDGGFLAQYLIRLRGMSKASKMRSFKENWFLLLARGILPDGCGLIQKSRSPVRSLLLQIFKVTSVMSVIGWFAFSMNC